jgi:prevent-host-death family protein
MTTLSLADARADFSKLVATAHETHERFEITKNGERVAVLLSADDFDSLVETLEILSDPEAMAGVAAGLADIAAGRTKSVEEVAARLRAAGRIS